MIVRFCFVENCQWRVTTKRTHHNTSTKLARGSQLWILLHMCNWHEQCPKSTEWLPVFNNSESFEKIRNYLISKRHNAVLPWTNDFLFAIILVFWWKRTLSSCDGSFRVILVILNVGTQNFAFHCDMLETMTCTFLARETFHTNFRPLLSTSTIIFKCELWKFSFWMAWIGSCVIRYIS
jgi:hypothetical protein